MKRSILSFLPITLLMILPCRMVAQGPAPQTGSMPTTGSITFTFNSPCEDCSTQNGEAGDNHYFIDVPAANNPLPTVSGFSGELSMELKVKSNHLVYAIPFQPGTSPRALWRNGGRVLQVFLVAPSKPQNTTSQTSTEPPPGLKPVGSTAAVGDVINNDLGSITASTSWRSSMVMVSTRRRSCPRCSSHFTKARRMRSLARE